MAARLARGSPFESISDPTLRRAATTESKHTVEGRIRQSASGFAQESEFRRETTERSILIL
jgi:hypothetical protein